MLSRRELVATVALAICALVLGGAVMARHWGRQGEKLEFVGQPSSQAPRLTAAIALEHTRGGIQGGAQLQEASAVCMVHVVGAVRKPGVYRLAADLRVLDAVEAAGGALPAADLDQVNLARKLEDGEQIRIPRGEEAAVPQKAAETQTKGKAPSSSRSSSPSTARKMQGTKDGQISLNSANSQQLQRLPGVGPATAQRILQKRKELGGKYRYVEQLLEIRGIGPKKLAQMRPFVRL